MYCIEQHGKYARIIMYCIEQHGKYARIIMYCRAAWKICKDYNANRSIEIVRTTTFPGP